ncbi:MAG: hypothetical protein AMXMBFR4_19140 [Candidatus Hydrogenedentota bacterium]
MGNSPNDPNLPARSAGRLPEFGHENVLDTAIANLPPSQRDALIEKALERKLDLETDARRAEMRYRQSSADMENTVRHVRDLEMSTKSDYSVRAEFNTASGRTNVEIKKSNNLTIIVIAIVLGIIVLWLFSN